MTGSAISAVAQPCLRVNPRHVHRDIAAMPSRGVGRAASQRRAFARDTIPLRVYASGSPIIHRRNRRSVRRLIWPSTRSLLAMAQPQALSCCHRFVQASIQASASYSFMEIVFHIGGGQTRLDLPSMSGDIGIDAVNPAQHGREQELVMVGEMPLNARAQLLLLLYLVKRGTPKVRIHGRPRSERKRSFLLSAVAPSTSTRHPREARPINWAQRGGLASGGNTLLTPRPHFTAPSCTLGNQVVRASDGTPFRQERRPTRLYRTPGAVAVCSPKQAHCELVIVS
jgi:hypothetical protein